VFGSSKRDPAGDQIFSGTVLVEYDPERLELRGDLRFEHPLMPILGDYSCLFTSFNQLF